MVSPTFPDSACSSFQDTRTPTTRILYRTQWGVGSAEFKSSRRASNFPVLWITMFPSKGLLLLILISLSVVDASPLSRRTGKTTLSLATRINESGTLTIVERDRARAQAFKNADHLRKSGESISVTNAQVIYTAQVGVGSPATECTWIFTGPRHVLDDYRYTLD